MRRWAAALLSVLLLSGCRDERIIEKIGFIRTIAYDTTKDEGENSESGNLRVTVSIPKTNQKDTIQYSTVAKTGKQARLIFDRQNDRRLVSGQLRQVLFTTDIARRGVWSEVNSLLRDPGVGMRIHLLIVESDPERLLAAKFTQDNTAGDYIDHLVRTETRTTDIPDTNMHIFARDYYDDGIEPVMSILQQTPNSIRVGGIGLFRGDRYVGKIEAADKVYFGVLRGKVQTGEVFIDFPDDGYSSQYASLHYFTSRRKIRIERAGPMEDGQGLRVRIQIKLRGSLLEYRGGLQLEHPKEQKKLEGEIAGYFRQKCEETIRRMQELHSDAIGIGQRVRDTMSYRDWRNLDWDEAFSKARIEVQVNADIRSYGSIQ
ncbi:Ger(x)C family spore germination protein [Cohnella lubricantis]|uniref:Ger(X)C family spore germination protein n=1 Tax=Cohnella lubricantis TaxID=2163172 RepID=A0A841T7P4_9BACL|nr:Ger(x)C family spore germination protein [Cohnella lubricantis]MBB6675995.1 Ger(x)C family spore germination protein [Cohnella lubricantis]MBP2117885.1 spore germination protein [Cohnella lubricantis]